MKILTIICNIVLFVFTCFVLVTDGTPKETSYIIFTLLVLLILILNVIVLSRNGTRDGRPDFHMKRKATEERRKMDSLSSMGTVIRIGAIICSIVLFGFIYWAFLDQYPHPEEDGVIAYAILMVLTPILSLVALFRSRAGDGR